MNRIKKMILPLMLAGASVFGQETKYTNVELMMPNIAQDTYGSAIPSYVYTNISGLPVNSEPLKVLVHDGFYRGNLDATQDLWLIGKNESANIEASIDAKGLLILDNINFNGLERQIAIVGRKGTNISNCNFEGSIYTCVDTQFPTNTTYNTFKDVPSNTFGALSFFDLGLDYADDIQDPTAIIRNNTFERCDKSILLYLNADLGTAVDGGDNSFIDCDTAIYNTYDGTVWAMENYFETTESALKSMKGLESRVLTNPAEIQALQVVNESPTGQVIVSGLSYNPNIEPQQPVSVPTNSLYGLGILSSVMALVGYKTLKKDKKRHI